MTLSPDALLAAAREETGLDDLGGDDWREGLQRLCDALDAEAELTELGAGITQHRLQRLLANRLRIEHTYATHPEIADEEVTAPIFVVGLPRTGTTATSQLLSADPAIRSLRLWESSDPVPPPRAETQHDDPRIARTQAGLDAMYETFPRMRTLHWEVATGSTECQDLLGMSFRAEHFDGMAHVPSYTDWVLDADMRPAYRYHRRVLQLLQWRCPPTRWHLKTPVHLLHLEHLARTYPDARFLWTHRDPTQVLASVCDLIAYTRSWVGTSGAPHEVGAQQLRIWSTAIERGLRFRERVGESRFADLAFADLNADPVGALARAYDGLGLTLSDEAASAMRDWAQANPRGGRGAHTYDLADWGLDEHEVRDAFAGYLDRFGAATA